MFFEGALASNLETTVLDVLQHTLEAGFAAPDVAAQFARFGGVQITRRPEQGFEWFTKSKRPFLFLQMDGDEQFDFKKVVDNVLRFGTRHEVTLGVEAICATSCADAERPLRDCLRRILEGAYATLRDAGLEGNRTRVLKPDEHPDRRNPIQITATVHTLV